uniref:AAA+ ATPase domain-containing protein n=1 Tax=Chromera velia CCMP2878 TaxID=1169474 RepID=A0A0G4GGU2_9ALVE|eukprot:Cvel_21840.t1-p1 / transcript=Cvel_21840.t1 / gene=Cvel_21840 / organism=Chromera_velia_CCMP2878 / gene_product=ATP-dependent zinc metalloprotease FtsH 3, putative / transcript_product=ATP-dependent zinc metalloprotease FtsH 3, putative / location=Cvel_scaffold2085:21578-23592(+) / protein_length=637 / sequence_SO=supercontig / SO=protein_coding / is_pseudo=false
MGRFGVVGANRFQGVWTPCAGDRKEEQEDEGWEWLLKSLREKMGELVRRAVSDSGGSRGEGEKGGKQAPRPSEESRQPKMETPPSQDQTSQVDPGRRGRRLAPEQQNLLKKAEIELKKKFTAEEQIRKNHMRNQNLTSMKIMVDILSTVSGLIPLLFLLANFSGRLVAALKSLLVKKKDRVLTFDDVIGLEEAKEELKEVADFLQHPKQYRDLGVRIPAGVILEGPPGSGKTLLAKALAAEAKASFIATSGSSFGGVLMGLAAMRIRSLFQRARACAPCIVFIDEFDSLAKKRFSESVNKGAEMDNDLTVNQLLTELDGFVSRKTNKPVILIAATNRAESLDPAVMRPGRFDRKIFVGYPDVKAREGILRHYMKGKPTGEDVEDHLSKVAKRTIGWSGAHLENLINEAALFAGRRNASEVGAMDLEAAFERHMLGPRKKGDTWKSKDAERVLRVTAIHEAGHALVSTLHPDGAEVQSVTIVPRTGAAGVGGFTSFIPSSDDLQSLRRLEGQLAMAMGGRAAEEVALGERNVTTGATGDIAHATQLARLMVEEFGFAPEVGLVKVGEGGFFRRSPGDQEKSDSAVRRLTQQAFDTAKGILEKNRNLLFRIADLLAEKETISGDELRKTIEKHTKGDTF